MSRRFEDIPYLPSTISGSLPPDPPLPQQQLGSMLQPQGPPMASQSYQDPRIAQLQQQVTAMNNPQPPSLIDRIGTIARGVNFQPPAQFAQQEQARLGMQADQEQRKRQALMEQLNMALQQQQMGVQNARQAASDRREAQMFPVEQRTREAQASTAELGLNQAQRAENADKYTGFSEGQTVIVTDKSGKEVSRFTVPKAGSLDEQTAQAWLAKPENAGKTLADFNEYNKTLTQRTPLAEQEAQAWLAKPENKGKTLADYAAFEKQPQPTAPMSEARMEQEKGLAQTRADISTSAAQTRAEQSAEGKSQASVKEIESSYNALKNLAALNTWAGDQAMADQYFNIIKPGSGARMNEANIQRLLTPGPLADKMTVWAQKLSQGQALDPAARQDMINAAKAVLDAKKAGNAPAAKPAGPANNAGSTAASPAAPAMPKVGEVKNGYRYNGGDPSKPSSWTKVP